MRTTEIVSDGGVIFSFVILGFFVPEGHQILEPIAIAFTGKWRDLWYSTGSVSDLINAQVADAPRTVPLAVLCTDLQTAIVSGEITGTVCNGNSRLEALRTEALACRPFKAGRVLACLPVVSPPSNIRAPPARKNVLRSGKLDFPTSA